MKKTHSSFMFLLFLNLLSLICVLTGCSAFQSPFLEEDDLFSLSVTQNTDTAISGIHYEYSITDDACGGGEVYNADHSLLSPGEVLYLSFTASDFPENSDLSGFSIQFFIIDEAGSELPADEPLYISVTGEYSYTVSLEGNAEDGFRAVLK